MRRHATKNPRAHTTQMEVVIKVYGEGVLRSNIFHAMVVFNKMAVAVEQLTITIPTAITILLRVYPIKLIETSHGIFSLLDC